MASWKEIRQRISGNDSRREKEQRRVADASPATRADMRRLRMEMRGDSRPDRSGASNAAGKAGRMVKRGFDDVARSMSTTNAPGRRPRISQMPKRSECDIIRTPNVDRMKMGGLRGRDIRGKRIK